MDVLVPIDGSNCSLRALEFGVQLAQRFDGEVKVVHLTEFENEATDAVIENARTKLQEMDAGVDPDVVVDSDITYKRSSKIGKDILDIAATGDYDHIVMGRHGPGAIEKLVVGSVSDTVIKNADLPVTLVT